MDKVKATIASTPNEIQGTEADRRSFLKTTLAAGSATAGLSSSTFLARSAHAAGSDIIKVGLVGCGGRGSGAAKDAMTADPGCRLTAIADVFYERMNDGKKNLSKTLGDQYAVTDDQSFSGWECLNQILATDIDVVLLATPPGFRPAQMEAAVKAGKHVFCEKPVAVDPVGVRRVMAASEMAKERGLSVVSGLCWRYDLGVKATMEQIFSGAIGEIVTIQENYLTGTLWSRVPKPEWTPMHNQVLNWLYYRWLSGDHIVEQFIHSLDKAMWLHNDVPPVKCYGTGGRQVRTEEKFGDIYDHFAVVYEWEDGTRCFAQTRQMSECFSETEDFVFGTKGTAKILANSIKGETNWRYEGNKPSMYELEHVALMNSIRRGEALNNGDYMSKSTLMAIMGREAAYSGQVITWKDMMESDMKLGPDDIAWGEAPEVAVPMPGRYRFVEE
ncbi:MAG: Gfo/Idh/MocA family protein [Pirellula sp.]|jgi:myo-inositol 2-dehydrogenase/D-chiro-inositol 1-dehydrogenase